MALLIPRRNPTFGTTTKRPLMLNGSTPRYSSLQEFVPYCLSEHQDPTCRMLHFTGTGLIALWIVLAVVTQNTWWLILIPLVGHGFASVGHTFLERIEPATFEFPFYRLAGDLNLFLRLHPGSKPFRPKA
ncbi:MAG TPA: DUF962 domain-containing protein [Flavobacteriales bacterium]|jgi:hypothetical protein|nr:DUF962 domain-containing protein [Flavobacteriales bacterium]